MIVGLDPDVIAALSQPNVTALYAIKLDLVSGVSRLHSGLGELVLAGEVEICSFWGLTAPNAPTP